MSKTSSVNELKHEIDEAAFLKRRVEIEELPTFKKLKRESYSSSPTSPPAQVESKTVYVAAPKSPSPPVQKEFDQNSDQSKADNHKTVKLRFMISTKEAGIIIGKGGAQVAEVREQTGMRIMVTPHVAGASDRVMTMSGPLNSLGRAIYLIAQKLIARNEQRKNETTLRVLVPAPKMGYIIGKGGSRIKELQNDSGARIVSDSENLPKTTERIMTLTGSPESLQIATYSLGSFIGNYLDEDSDMILFDPSFPTSSEPSPRYYSSTPSYSNNDQTAALYASYLPQLQLLASQYQQYFGNQAKPISTDSPKATESTIQYFAQPQSYSTPLVASTPFTADQLYGLQSSLSSSYNPLSLLQSQYQNYYAQAQAQALPTNSTAYPPNQSFQNYNQEMVVPASLVGNIIGKQGANIKNIRTTTNCEVEFSDKIPGQTHRTVYITGAQDQCAKAASMIQKIVDSQY